jgi:beta-lactamase superfamily II metal-dependent hydrolase
MPIVVRIFDVEHGACAMVGANGPPMAMIDCGHNETTGWRPGNFIRTRLGRTHVDYLLITNVDQDHISDLANMTRSGISIGTLISNTGVSPETLRRIKLGCGPLTADAETYLAMRAGFGPPGSGTPFERVMGGFSLKQFSHGAAFFDNTNDLSSVFFLSYGPFKILFPGDLEKAGWRVHLANPEFRQELMTTTILVASHHGRENGFCEEVFNYLRPQAVVISDKSIVHGTQEMVPNYRQVVRDNGILLTNETDRRHVLTTRRDGDIVFSILDTNGNYNVTTRVT